MPSSGATVAAHSAGDMSFCRHSIARLKAADLAAAFDDFTVKLMPNREWHRNRFAGPFIPFVNVDVGAADGGAADPNEYIVMPGYRFLDILKPDTGFGFGFDQCSHVPFETPSL